MAVRGTIIDNLVTAARVIKTSNDYDIKVAEVYPYDVNFLGMDRAMTPVIMVIDAGPEELLVEDEIGGNNVFSTEVQLWGYASGHSYAKAAELLGKLSSALKKFIQSNPSLGDNALSLSFAGAYGNIYIPIDGRKGNTVEAYTGIRARLIYYSERGES